MYGTFLAWQILICTNLQVMERHDYSMKKTEQFMTKTMVVWLGALICCALWGSASSCIKLGYQWFQIPSDAVGTQILFAGCRFTLAGLLAILIGSILRRKLLLPQRESLGKIVKLSMLQTVGQYIFYYIGLANTSGVKASIIGGVNVFIAILVASLIFHQEALTARKIIGSIIGFAGVVLVNVAGNGIAVTFTWNGEGAILLSTIAYAFSSVFLKRYSKSEDPVILSGYQFVVGGMIMILFGWLMGGRLTAFTGKGIAILIYLAMVSAVAYSLWGILLKYNPVSRVAVFGFMNPVFGVILSAILLDESGSLGAAYIVSLVLVCIGIYIVNRSGKN